MRTLILAIVLTGCASAQRWTQRALFAEIGAVAACDYGQTSWMSDHGKWDRQSAPDMRLQESDPLLGSQPSGTVIAVAPVAAMGVLAVGYVALPNRWRWVMLVTAAVAETANVVRNAAIEHTQGARRCGGY